MQIYINNHEDTVYKLRILHNPPAIRTRNQNTETQIWKRSRSHPPITPGLYLPGWVYAPWRVVAEAAYGQE